MLANNMSFTQSYLTGTAGSSENIKLPFQYIYTHILIKMMATNQDCIHEEV
jgi:hypothetical protein